MTTKQKQAVENSLLAAVKYIASAQAQLQDAVTIMENEITQLYIGRLLTHKKGASPEMFDLSEEKYCLLGMIEQIARYAEQLTGIAPKYN